MDGNSGVSFSTLVHRNGGIKRVPVVVVSTGVKYDCLSLESDEYLQADPPRSRSQFMRGRVTFRSPSVVRYRIVLRLSHLMLTCNQKTMMGAT
ncbi:hypothetical protein PIB30_060429 [Stylosanthes scabra]|uniref:Uncharacterized protein n=1 Tax=Stylosanthes scabra TaxID=79078 RepID=A0ABU6TKA3_9FABA|nr:hypothetical protein [Stylosanthes scabra]